MHGSAALPVQAWDQRRTNQLDAGKVIAVDNQINAATGTVMLKAEFSNSRLSLFPNQFVNTRLLLNTLNSVLTVPSAAIATGAPGSYVYVIDSDNKVALRRVTTGVTNKEDTIITAGLKTGERVVTDGLDRLRDGSQVRIITPSTSAAHTDKHKR
jgi:multidrug efflux system membrane fusion protein